jgi:segregation and condensation protein B
MNEFYIRNVIEAALLAAGKPLQLADIGQLFDESTRPNTDDLRAAIDVLTQDYSNRGIEVKETAAGFRIQVRREFSAEISRLWPERPARYSRALLETLALIAYRQPITRAEIEAVRGVAVNPNIVKTVIERNWVRVVGHRDVPGRPELLGTTREFLDYFGLRSLDELPPLAELKAMGDYNLQLELPNGVAADGEPRLEGSPEVAEGGAPVVALLTSDALATAADASTDGNVAVSGADGIGDESVLASDAPEDVVTSEAAAHTATADAGTGGGAHPATADIDTGAAAHPTTAHADIGSVAHTATSETNAASLAHSAASDTDTGSGVHTAKSDADAGSAVYAATADTRGADSAHADTDTHTVTTAQSAAAHPDVEEGAHPTPAGRHASRHAHAAPTDTHGVAGRNSSEGAHHTDADSDAEAERTLASGEAAHHSTAESDDSDASNTASSNESVDALDDSADDDADEDELSADGHGSRELVAAPPDLDD